MVDIERDNSVKAFQALGCAQAAARLDPYHQNGFFLDLESGAITAQEFCRELSREAGRPVTFAQAQQAWLAFLTALPPYRLDYLLQLRNTYKVYLLSNTNPFIMDWARSPRLSVRGRALDVYFDKLFISYELRCVKPDRAIFERLVAGAPLLPRESLFVDDSPANIQAGREMGFRTLLVQNGEDWRPRVDAMLQ